MKFFKNKNQQILRSFTEIKCDASGELTTELHRRHTLHTSPRIAVSDILYTKRCRIIQPEKLVELCEKYFKHKHEKLQSLRVYICGEYLIIYYPQRKVEMNILDFEPLSEDHKNMSKKHLLKIQREKQFILARKEFTLFSSPKNNVSYISMVQ